MLVAPQPIMQTSGPAGSHGQTALFYNQSLFELTMVFVWQFFEWMITLDQEISLVWQWNSNWSLTKLTFLVNRYLVIFDFALTYIRNCIS